MANKLSDLPTLKWKIINELKNNRELTKLIYYTSITPLEEGDVMENLMYKKIFPFPFCPDTITVDGIQLRIYVANVELEGSVLEKYLIVFEIVVPNDEDSWNVEINGEKSDRPLEIASRIAQTLNGKRFGTGFQMRFTALDCDEKISENFTSLTLCAKLLSIKSG